MSGGLGWVGWVVHSLGTIGAVLAAATAGLLAAGEARQRAGGVRRLRKALGGPRRRWMRPGQRRRLPEPLREWGPVVAAGLGVAVLAGGLVGVLAGAGTAYGARRWLRGRQTAAQRPADDREGRTPNSRSAPT